LDQGKAPFQLDGPPIAAEVQVVAEHDPEAVPFPEIVTPDFTMAEVIYDIGVIVIRGCLRDTVPAPQEKREIPPFKPRTGHDAVPAPGQRFGLAVGLVIKAHIYEPASQAQKGIVGPKVDQEFRLIIRFPEGGGVFNVVNLPERPLAIGGPKIRLLVEDIGPKFDFEAQLESGFFVLEIFAGVGRPHGIIIGR